MTNKENKKKSWQAPVILDLDVEDKTEGKVNNPFETSGDIVGPS